MASRRKKPLAEINVVPYIDVMLVLLVIFMITAPLLTQGVQVHLPKASAKTLSPKKDEPLVVSIDHLGNYYLNVDEHPTHTISAQKLMTEVAAYLEIAKQKHQHRHVYVKGDQNVNYGKVVQAMVMLQRAGAEEVGLITDPNGKK